MNPTSINTSAGSRVIPSMSAKDAIPKLMSLSGGRLHGLSLRLCGNAADAEDMLQDVYLQAFRKWHTFRGESNPLTWLYAIAARSCRAKRRRKGGIDRRAPALSQLMPWTESTVMEIAAKNEAVGQSVDRKEAIDRVQSEIAQLPEHLRMPIIMKDVLELSVEDTASALGLTINTVKTRVHRARLALRKAMTAKGRAIQASLPIFEKQVCLDLLKAKLRAMDRGGVADGFTVTKAEMCARCSAVFRELDLVQNACEDLGASKMPAAIRKRILDAIAQQDAQTAQTKKPRRGRKPGRGKL